MIPVPSRSKLLSNSSGPGAPRGSLGRGVQSVSRPPLPAAAAGGRPRTANGPGPAGAAGPRCCGAGGPRGTGPRLRHPQPFSLPVCPRSSLISVLFPPPEFADPLRGNGDIPYFSPKETVLRTLPGLPFPTGAGADLAAAQSRRQPREAQPGPGRGLPASPGQGRGHTSHRVTLWQGALGHSRRETHAGPFDWGGLPDFARCSFF